MPPWLAFLASAIAALALSAAVADAASGTTIVEPSEAHFPYQRWIDEAEIPTPEGSLTVIETGAPHGCPTRSLDYSACTDPTASTIWLAPEAVMPSPRFIFLHEVGHNVVLPGWMQARFMVITHLSGPWAVVTEPQVRSPNERFADAYAECAIEARQGEGILGRERHNRVCRMLAKLPDN